MTFLQKATPFSHFLKIHFKIRDRVPHLLGPCLPLPLHTKGLRSAHERSF
jgi:hypothetical protein